MAKHPVPKKKTSRARGNRRYKAFQNKARRRLADAVTLAKCDACGATIRAHHACQECGNFRGKSTRTETTTPETGSDEKVTTIKAD
jgi:large subunit ribosomal protein L32